MGLPPEILLLDHDRKFTDQFDAVFESEGAKVQRVGPKAAKLNAYAERYAHSLRRECLSHFMIRGERHLRHVVGEWERHYLEERLHQRLTLGCRRFAIRSGVSAGPTSPD